MTIYHLVWESDWNRCLDGDLYRADSLSTEGFIHCTREPEKLLEVANTFFREHRVEKLILLSLDEDLLQSDVRYEDPGIGHLFPHVYGPIEVAAIICAEDMEHIEGEWTLPMTYPTAMRS
ncbi:DUF952 domain-containing protein [bacterium]|nr:DUF952 domain-containing protein [bacterium]